MPSMTQSLWPYYFCDSPEKEKANPHKHPYSLTLFFLENVSLKMLEDIKNC